MTDLKRDARKRYEAPQMVVHGGVAEITGFDPQRVHLALGGNPRRRMFQETPKPS